jgi:two-component system, NarL family, nitrate/nitrite response regulator NarL
MPSRNVLTTVVGPKGLLRDSLTSLLGGYSYRVTDSHHTAADIPSLSEEEGPRLVLLIARAADVAVTECAVIRQTSPNCKIVGLLEKILDEDFQKLAHSPIDGCVPLDVSQDLLTRALDLVVSGAARFIVLADRSRLSTSPAAEGQQTLDPNSGSSGDGLGLDRAATAERRAKLSATAKVLSEREKQIIDGVVEGQSNKIIARACGISESTVKVHMKAILRKVRCSNRTQLAIWALDQAPKSREEAVAALPLR